MKKYFNKLILFLIGSIAANGLLAQVTPDLQNTKSTISVKSPDSVNNKPKMQFTVGGRIKLQGIYDFKGLQSQTGFQVFKIPTPNTPTDNRFYFGAENSRLKFDARINNENLGEIKAYIEGDFAGSGNSFRLRHGYVKWKGFLMGQTWSLFTDDEAFPSIIDNDGPATSVWLRTPQARYSSRKGDDEWGVSLEFTSQLYEPIPDFDTLVKTTYVNAPDLIARYRRFFPWGHIQLSGVLRSIDYKSGTENKSVVGGGVNLTTKIFTNQNKKDNFILQIIAGSGIAKYLNGLNFANIDALPDGTGNLKTLPVLGGFTSYQFYFGQKKNLSSTWVYGYTNLANKTLTKYGKYAVEASYFSGNIAWILAPQFQIALEGLYGMKHDYKGNTGTATRIQFMTLLDF